MPWYLNDDDGNDGKRSERETSKKSGDFDEDFVEK